jgi:hypothetical protein
MYMFGFCASTQHTNIAGLGGSVIAGQTELHREPMLLFTCPGYRAVQHAFHTCRNILRNGFSVLDYILCYYDGRAIHVVPLCAADHAACSPMCAPRVAIATIK